MKKPRFFTIRLPDFLMAMVLAGNRSFSLWLSSFLMAMMLVSQVSLANVAADNLRQENQNKLASMSDSEKAGLDRELAGALDLYYRKNFTAALPIFQRIASRIETMDLMFWIGTSAAKTGQYDLAKQKFEQMLAIDPALFRVRLEYSDLLVQTGKQAQARRQLELVNSASPPPAVQQNINRRLAKMQSAPEKTQLTFSLSSGYQYDDNISSGPDNDVIVIATGNLNLANNQQETDGSNWLIKSQTNVLHDIGSPAGVIWGGSLNLYSSRSSEDDQFNFAVADFSTGPVWVLGQAVIKLPAGYKATWYGDKRLSDIVHIDPALRYNATDSLSWHLGYSWANESYDAAKYFGNDNDLHQLSMGTSIQVNDKKGTLSGNLIWEQRDADASTFSYNTWGLELLYHHQISDQTDLFVKYRHHNRDYDAPPPLYVKNRDDQRDSLSATVNYRFGNRLYVSAGYLYMNNDSNASLYEFDKNTFTLDIGITI